MEDVKIELLVEQQILYDLNMVLVLNLFNFDILFN